MVTVPFRPFLTCFFRAYRVVPARLGPQRAGLTQEDEPASLDGPVRSGFLTVPSELDLKRVGLHRARAGRPVWPSLTPVCGQRNGTLRGRKTTDLGIPAPFIPFLFP